MYNVTQLIQLWDNTRGGDQKSYALLHQSLYPGLFIYAVKIIKDEDLADDLLQDLFINFWQKRQHIGSIKNVKSYFYRATRSIVLNYIKSTQALATKLDAMPEPEFEFTKEDLILSREFDEKLKGLMTVALNKLPSKQREVIYMRFYENMDYNEIAEITGTRYQSVVNNVYRGIQVLRNAAELIQIYAGA